MIVLTTAGIAGILFFLFSLRFAHSTMRALLGFVHLSHDRQRLTTLQVLDPVSFEAMRQNGEMEKIDKCFQYARDASLYCVFCLLCGMLATLFLMLAVFKLGVMYAVV